MMESLLKAWDGENVIIRHDKLSGAWIFIAIHSTQLGPAIGGTRMQLYPDPQAGLQDALRLSAGMTYKFAVSGMPYGGGKAVIAIPTDFEQQSRQALLLRFGSLVKKFGGLFSAGADVGTSSEDMNVIAQTGEPYIFSRTPDQGGAGPSGGRTATGVFTAIQVTCQRLFGDSSLQGRRVLVQGAGSVGGALIEMLIADGAEVMFNDLDPDVIRHFGDDLGLEFISTEDVYQKDCEIFSPCALGGMLNAETIPELRCKAVVGGANNQVANPDDAENLKARGILYAPDYVVNVGGAMAGIGIEAQGWTQAQANYEVIEAVKLTLNQVYKLADIEGITPDAAALRIAKELLAGG